LTLSGTGLAGFPARVVTFAGLPMNAAAAIGLMALGALLVRRAGAVRPGQPAPAGRTALREGRTADQS
ncbi:MAG: hypothetical protein WCF36_05295, partial [Candidatus Nanopelagicales bacterium]